MVLSCIFSVFNSGPTSLSASNRGFCVPLYGIYTFNQYTDNVSIELELMFSIQF
jgi:hypothetical protein